MGEYRDKLMSAYIDHYRSRRHLDRLSPLAKEGAVTGKQMLEAEADWNASRTTLQSLVEQLEQDARQQSITSSQMVKELQTRVAVDETNLKILGFSDAELAGVDPARQGESISHYPIHAPFDGTIISKDVVLFERVGPETQILSIADLSTVWVTADIYEEHLPLLPQLTGQPIRLYSGAWPGKVFEARVFYTGDLVAESSRTISLRAVADNADGLLKPGMFVSVELPSLQAADVLQVPLSAVQDHEGKAFVFVHTGAETFVRRDVTLGRRNAEAVEIVAGLRRGEIVVTGGGFALKSRMLASLLEE
jgi:cobalt-zinc-cadmium efflux system membrane fusion protein